MAHSLHSRIQRYVRSLLRREHSGGWASPKGTVFIHMEWLGTTRVARVSVAAAGHCVAEYMANSVRYLPRTFDVFRDTTVGDLEAKLRKAVRRKDAQWVRFGDRAVLLHHGVAELRRGSDVPGILYPEVTGLRPIAFWLRYGNTSF